MPAGILLQETASQIYHIREINVVPFQFPVVNTVKPCIESASEIYYCSSRIPNQKIRGIAVKPPASKSHCYRKLRIVFVFQYFLVDRVVRTGYFFLYYPDYFLRFWISDDGITAFTLARPRIKGYQHRVGYFRHRFKCFLHSCFFCLVHFAFCILPIVLLHPLSSATATARPGILYRFTVSLRKLSRTVLSGTSENKRSGANKKIIETNININFFHLLFIMPEVFKMFS